MRLAAAALAVAAVALPALADARPFTAGVGIGRSQSKADAAGDASDTMQVFGRLSFTKRLAVQLELQKLQMPYGDATVRSGTLHLVVELGSRGHFVPLLFAGYGGDKLTDAYGYEISASHTEGGVALEYRADGGLTIGADLRLGGRSIDDGQYKIQPAYNDNSSIALYQPETLQAGEYRSARIYAAVRF
jgi:hypothetical protein